MYLFNAIIFLSSVVPASTCDDCFGPRNNAAHVRHVPRMQPDALNATDGPRGPLAWGQLNFIHSTDTHGWLEGHVLEQNYGADWGDFVSYTRHLKQRAGNLGVDLLLVDTGDLHDGNGLSDATTPDGVLSNPIFDQIEYDLLTIGNHELYLSSVAYETFGNFSKIWGDKYLTSNVQILNPATNAFEYIGKQYRYFTTPHGLRVLSFGVLYDFTGNTNVTKVFKAAEVVQQQWFIDIINTKLPVDIVVVLGHNPVRQTGSGSTFPIIFDAIRTARPNIPIQIFGGHTHTRDFAVYDTMSTALESGRYCETTGWLAMSGIESSNYTGNKEPRGVPNPTQKAVKVGGTNSTGVSTTSTSDTSSELVYFRRYLDFNRLTFSFHAVGSQSSTFDYHSGLRVSADITAIRQEFNLTGLYGCAPESYCASCKPFGSDGSIFQLIPIALGVTVVNTTRATIPRLIIINTGSIRFDLVEGPFTVDDSFIVSPFTDGFQYIPNVPYSIASKVDAGLNADPGDSKKRDLSTTDFDFAAQAFTGKDSCVDAVLDTVFVPGFNHEGLKKRTAPMTRGNHKRQVITPGYVTTDDFGTDGDDTIHTAIPYYPQPNYIQGSGSFPKVGTPATVDLIFLDFIASDVISILKGLGAMYTIADVSYYLPPTGPDAFTTQSYLPLYARRTWSQGPSCPIGRLIG